MAKAKTHQKEKERQKRRRLRLGDSGRTIRADGDYLIKAHETKVVRIEGDFGEDREWLVESNMIANADDSFFGVANTLITARKPAVPVSNLSNRPRFILRGEILGRLTDPEKFFDTPSSKEELEELRKKTVFIGTVLEANLAETESGSGRPEKETRNSRIRTDFGSGVPPMEENVKNGGYIRDEAGRLRDLGPLDDNLEESEDYGPKTAAMPDATIYPSERMQELLDIGSLPEDLKEKAWCILKRRVKAFGFDG